MFSKKLIIIISSLFIFTQLNLNDAIALSPASPFPIETTPKMQQQTLNTQFINYLDILGLTIENSLTSATGYEISSKIVTDVSSIVHNLYTNKQPMIQYFPFLKKSGHQKLAQTVINYLKELLPFSFEKHEQDQINNLIQFYTNALKEKKKSDNDRLEKEELSLLGQEFERILREKLGVYTKKEKNNYVVDLQQSDIFKLIFNLNLEKKAIIDFLKNEEKKPYDKLLATAFITSIENLLSLIDEDLQTETAELVQTLKNALEPAGEQDTLYIFDENSTNNKPPFNSQHRPINVTYFILGLKIIDYIDGGSYASVENETEVIDFLTNYKNSFQHNNLLDNFIKGGFLGLAQTTLNTLINFWAKKSPEEEHPTLVILKKKLADKKNGNVAPEKVEEEEEEEEYKPNSQDRFAIRELANFNTWLVLKGFGSMDITGKMEFNENIMGIVNFYQNPAWQQSLNTNLCPLQGTPESAVFFRKEFAQQFMKEVEHGNSSAFLTHVDRKTTKNILNECLKKLKKPFSGRTNVLMTQYEAHLKETYTKKIDPVARALFSEKFPDFLSQYFYSCLSDLGLYDKETKKFNLNVESITQACTKDNLKKRAEIRRLVLAMKYSGNTDLAEKAEDFVDNELISLYNNQKKTLKGTLAHRFIIKLKIATTRPLSNKSAELSCKTEIVDYCNIVLIKNNPGYRILEVQPTTVLSRALKNIKLKYTIPRFFYSEDCQAIAKFFIDKLYDLNKFLSDENYQTLEPLANYFKKNLTFAKNILKLKSYLETKSLSYEQFEQILQNEELWKPEEEEEEEEEEDEGESDDESDTEREEEEDEDDENKVATNITLSLMSLMSLPSVKDNLFEMSEDFYFKLEQEIKEQDLAENVLKQLITQQNNKKCLNISKTENLLSELEIKSTKEKTDITKELNTLDFICSEVVNEA